MPNWPRNRDPQEAHKVRRAQLIAKHKHTPEQVPHAKLATVLRAAGIRDEIHPNDCIAYVYKSRAEFRDWASTNNKYHGNHSYGPFVLEGLGLDGVVDYRN